MNHRTKASNVDYVRQLLGAGWKGLTSVRHQPDESRFTPRLSNLAWTSAAVGAATGFLAARLSGRRRGSFFPAIGGSLLGLGAGAAWPARHATNAAIRAALDRVNAVRDAHWLELNPIDYA